MKIMRKYLQVLNEFDVHSSLSKCWGADEASHSFTFNTVWTIGEAINQWGWNKRKLTFKLLSNASSMNKRPTNININQTHSLLTYLIPPSLTGFRHRDRIGSEDSLWHHKDCVDMEKSKGQKIPVKPRCH